jgi:hypothetical protein
MEHLRRHDKAFREDDWLRKVYPLKSCGVQQSHDCVVSSHRYCNVLNDSSARRGSDNTRELAHVVVLRLR